MDEPTYGGKTLEEMLWDTYGTTIYDVNRSIFGSDAGSGYNPEYLQSVYNQIMQQYPTASIGAGIPTPSADYILSQSGVPADGNYTQEDINTIAGLIGSGAVSIPQVSQFYGIPEETISSIYAANAPVENIITNPLLAPSSLGNQLTGLSPSIADIPAPDELPPVDITKEQYDQAVSAVGDIQRNENLTQEQQVNEISNVLTDLGVAHDPSTLDVLGGSDQYGLLSNRINIVEPTTDTTAATTDTTAAGDATTASTSSTDAQGGATGGASSYSWIYENGKFVYAPYDVAGKRLPGGESVNVSDVAGTEGKTFEEGQTVGLYSDPQTNQLVLEQAGTTDTGGTSIDWGNIFSTLGAAGVMAEMIKSGKSVADVSKESGVS